MRYMKNTYVKEISEFFRFFLFFSGFGLHRACPIFVFELKSVIKFCYF